MSTTKAKKTTKAARPKAGAKPTPFLLSEAEGAPLVVSYGMGVDSTAMLVGLHARRIRPDAIIFSDTGSEKPETYAYAAVIDAWLARVDFPARTIVRYQQKNRRPDGQTYTTLEENCLVNKTLPGLAFNRKSCSMKWKGEIIDRKARQLFTDHIKAGGHVLRAIGYDAGPCDSKRGGVETQGPWKWIYPLREWGWDRARCEAEIVAAGLPVPEKSACFYCPSMKPAELIQLARRHPDLARRAVALEDAARPRLIKISGLWGRGTKGTRGGVKRPGSWRVFLAEHAPEVLPPLPDDPATGKE